MILLLVFFICLASILVGILLAYLCREELEPGRKVFILLQGSIFIGFTLLFFNSFLDYNILIILFILFSLLLTIRMLPVYFLFSVALAAAYQHTRLFFTLAALVFIYGLPTGTLLAHKYLDSPKEIANKFMLNYAWIALTGIVLNYIL